MVAWCVKERESVNLFHRFRVVFYRSPRLVRAWPASQARASFSRRLKRILYQHCGSVVVFVVAFSIVTSLVLVTTRYFLLQRAVC